MKMEKDHRAHASDLHTKGFMCVFGEAVDCKYWSKCRDEETDVDPSDCPKLIYILREAEEQERMRT
jgi:hypothetical protein